MSPVHQVWPKPQSRHSTRWEDNIREWTGLEFGKSQRAVENRRKWRKRCKIICGAPTTLAVEGSMMMMMVMMGVAEDGGLSFSTTHVV